MLLSFEDPVIQSLDEKELKILLEILVDDQFLLKVKLVELIKEKLDIE